MSVSFMLVWNIDDDSFFCFFALFSCILVVKNRCHNHDTQEIIKNKTVQCTAVVVDIAFIVLPPLAPFPQDTTHVKQKKRKKKKTRSSDF